MSDVTTTTQPGLPANLEAFKAGVAKARTNLASAAGPGKPFLRLLKNEKWVYGQEDIVVEEGSKWAFNPLSLRHGWVCWKDTDKHGGKAEKLGELMVPITADLPARPDPLEKGEWQEQYGVDLKCMSGEDKGQEVAYVNTSHGMKQAIFDYQGLLMAQLDSDPTHIVAVTELMSSSYKHERYGHVVKPEFDFKEWITMDGVAAVPAIEEGQEAAPENAAEAPDEGKPQADPAPAQTSERRRRRRG